MSIEYDLRASTKDELVSSPPPPPLITIPSSRRRMIQRPHSSNGSSWGISGHGWQNRYPKVHDSIMGLDSPSYSRKGSFGNDKMLKVFDFKFKTPGPGSYNCRYGMYSFRSPAGSGTARSAHHYRTT